MKRPYALLLLSMLIYAALKAGNVPQASMVFSKSNVVVLETSFLESTIVLSDSMHHAEGLNKKRFIAAALAFPLPFGVLGLHRVYLGSQPYMPLVYIATLGGCLGVLPFIDFAVILLDKNFERFMNNPRVFMWNK